MIRGAPHSMHFVCGVANAHFGCFTVGKNDDILYRHFTLRPESQSMGIAQCQPRFHNTRRSSVTWLETLASSMQSQLTRLGVIVDHALNRRVKIRVIRNTIVDSFQSHATREESHDTLWCFLDSSIWCQFTRCFSLRYKELYSRRGYKKGTE